MILLAIVQLSHIDAFHSWKDAHALGPFIAAAVALILLIIIEGWIAPEPLLPRQVILDPGVFVIYIYIACLGVACK